MCEHGPRSHLLERGDGCVSSAARIAGSRGCEAVVRGSPVECPAPTPQPIQIGVISAAGQPRPRLRQLLHGPMSHPVLAAATGVGLVLMLVVVSLAYMTMTEQRLASSPAGSIKVERPQVTIVIPPTASAAMPATSTSGVMRGNRWQVTPGGFGGFSAGAADESY